MCSVLLEKLKVFFIETMEIEQGVEISDAYRVGQGSHRNVMNKLRYPGDKSLIFSNVVNLKEKLNAGGKPYFLQDELTDLQNEKKQKYHDLVKENKDSLDKNKLKIKMQRGNIIINNSVIKPKVKPPTAADMLRLDEDKLDKIKAIKITTGAEHVEKGSEFYSYALKVRNVQEVQNTYYKMHIENGDQHILHVPIILKMQLAPFNKRQ